MRHDDTNERTIEELLADPATAASPLGVALASLYESYRERLAQFERVVSISDGFQAAARARDLSLAERYDKQVRQLTKIIKISDQYQEMLRDAFQALRESENRFRSLVQAASQLVLTADAAGDVAPDVTPWNELTGQAPEETKGAGWLDAVHPDDRGRVAGAWAEAVGTHGVFRSGFRVRTASGAFRHFAASGVPVRDEDGAVRSWVVACADVTEAKVAEAVEAERAIAADRLAQLAIVASTFEHEINNPMSIIYGNAQLLGRIEGLSDADRARVAKIEEAARRASELTGRLRELREVRVRELGGIEQIEMSGAAEASATGPSAAETAAAEAERRLLRHTVATLAYRAGKAVAGAPAAFAHFRASEGTRTPLEILAHIGDLLDWALSHARGDERWHDSAPESWDAEVGRFFAALRAFDEYLASGAPLGASAEKLFQGPVADALTHVGQIAILRRQAEAPVRGENYLEAEIEVGRVGAEQSTKRVEFD